MENNEMENKEMTMFGKVKAFGKKHWKKLAIGAGAIGLGTIGLLVAANCKKDSEEVSAAPEFTEPDYGRDVEMKFIVEETGEELGSVKCTESYAKDMIEIAAE